MLCRSCVQCRGWSGEPVKVAGATIRRCNMRGSPFYRTRTTEVGRCDQFKERTLEKAS